MIDENGSVFRPIDQSDMIARIESFDVDEDDHALAGPEPADTLMAPSVPPAPAPPAPASASASAPVPEADVAPSPAPVPVAHEPAVAVDPVAIMESEQVFREEDPALVYRTQFILGGPEATIGQ